MMTMMMEALVTWPGTVATILMSGSAEVLALGRDPDLVIKIMIMMITKITLMLDGHGDDDDYFDHDYCRKIKDEEEDHESETKWEQ